MATEDRYHWNTMVSDLSRDEKSLRAIYLMVDLDLQQSHVVENKKLFTLHFVNLVLLKSPVDTAPRLLAPSFGKSLESSMLDILK